MGYLRSHRRIHLDAKQTNSIEKIEAFEQIEVRLTFHKTKSTPSTITTDCRLTDGFNVVQFDGLVENSAFFCLGLMQNSIKCLLLLSLVIS